MKARVKIMTDLAKAAGFNICDQAFRLSPKPEVPFSIADPEFVRLPRIILLPHCQRPDTQARVQSGNQRLPFPIRSRPTRS
jgi:hypothetical protein